MRTESFINIKIIYADRFSWKKDQSILAHYDGMAR